MYIVLNVKILWCLAISKVYVDNIAFKKNCIMILKQNINQIKLLNLFQQMYSYVDITTAYTLNRIILKE